jgi:hypothetical protein
MRNPPMLWNIYVLIALDCIVDIRESLKIIAEHAHILMSVVVDKESTC